MRLGFISVEMVQGMAWKEINEVEGKLLDVSTKDMNAKDDTRKEERNATLSETRRRLEKVKETQVQNRIESKHDKEIEFPLKCKKAH